LILTVVLGWGAHKLPAAPVERFFRLTYIIVRELTL
jgi:hypothetical protein